MQEENVFQFLHVQANQFLAYVLVLQIFDVAFQKVILALPMEEVESVFQLHRVLAHLYQVIVSVLLVFNVVLPKVVHRVLQMDSVEVMLMLLLVQSKAMVMYFIQ
jgi:hypothetical protein